MTETLDKLIAALREELQHYGEMLALLDQQQESAINRHADEMLVATTAIQNHAAVIQTARKNREQSQRFMARDLCVAEASTFVEIIPLLPADYRRRCWCSRQESRLAVSKSGPAPIGCWCCR
jgi:hypothetical protein